MISVPTINVARLEDVPPQVAAPDEPVAAVLMHMLGDLTGRTLLVFPQRDGASPRRAAAAPAARLGDGLRRDGAVGDQGSRQHPELAPT